MSFTPKNHIHEPKRKNLRDKAEADRRHAQTKTPLEPTRTSSLPRTIHSRAGIGTFPEEI